jgi:hypothetical protein
MRWRLKASSLMVGGAERPVLAHPLALLSVGLPDSLDRNAAYAVAAYLA